MNLIKKLFNKKEVILNKESSVISINEKLFNAIRKAYPADEKFMISIWKQKDLEGNIIYTMWVNIDWYKHGIEDATKVAIMSKSLQTPLAVDTNGHVSFKSFVPTVMEILSVYDIPDNIAKLKATQLELNGETYWVFERP